MDSVSVIDYVVDKNQVPPIDQKRIVAFINHFVVNTVTFLNTFAVNCETKFIDFESKLHKVEASLAILEAKLDSIPGLEPVPTKIAPVELGSPADVASATDTVDQSVSPPESTSQTTLPDETINASHVDTESQSSSNSGVKASEDVRFRKYFKMLQFGVPPPAVKMKMEAEGIDAHMLDDPNRILEDGVREQAEE